jgi:iron complex outermembrane receptor protein
LRNNRIGFAPKWSGGGSIRYTQPLASDTGSISAQADFYAQSRIELQDLNVPNGYAAPYGIANIRLEWNNLLGSRISTALYVRNVLDKRYFNSGIAVNGVGVITKTYGAPRTFGIELNLPFGK